MDAGVLDPHQRPAQPRNARLLMGGAEAKVQPPNSTFCAVTTVPNPNETNRVCFWRGL